MQSYLRGLMMIVFSTAIGFAAGRHVTNMPTEVALHEVASTDANKRDTISQISKSHRSDLQIHQATDGSYQPDPAALSDSALALSLIQFIEEMRQRIPQSPSHRGSIRTVAFSANLNSAQDAEKLYTSIAESAGRVNSARERFRDSPSPESRVMLGCWLVIHGELLAIPPAARFIASLQAIAEGKSLLEEIRDPQKTPLKEIEALETAHPDIAILLHTMTFRAADIDATRQEEVDLLIAENAHKTRLASSYRTLAQLVLQADAAFHLRQWESADASFERASELARELAKQVAVEENDVLRGALKARRPFLFAPEPTADKRNPPVAEFIEKTSLVKILPTISALAKLNLLQSGEANPEGQIAELKNQIIASLDSSAADDNAMGYVVRGLARERLASLLIRQAMENPETASKDTLDAFNRAKQEAESDLQQAHDLLPATVNAPVKPQLIVKNDRYATAVASADSTIALLVALGAANAPAPIKNPILTAVEQSQARMESPEMVKNRLVGQLKAGDSDGAWRSASELVFYHPMMDASWSVYLVTGVRTYQSVEQLRRSLQLANTFNIFDASPAKLHELSGRVALYAGRQRLSESNHLLEDLLAGNESRTAEETGRLKRAAAEFQNAIQSFDRALEGVPPNSKRTELCVLASRAQAGALLALVAPTHDAVDRVQFRKDSRAVTDQASSELEKLDPDKDVAERFDLLETQAAALQAAGILNLLHDDPASIRIGKSALALSNDIFGQLKFGGQSLAENGSLLLAALYLRDDPTGQLQKEPLMRRALQMLVEGLVLSDLGSPDHGVDRLSRAQQFLHGTPAAVTEAPLPADYIWGLLRDERDEVDAGGIEKMARLSALLLRLKQQSSTYSRVLGDVAQPTQVDADLMLNAALAVIDKSSTDLTVDGVSAAIRRTERPVEAIGLALAVESKARSLRFSKREERAQWMKLSELLLSRAIQLQIEPDAEFTKKYPLLAVVEKELDRRVRSSETFLLRAKAAESRFGFDEAEQRLRDGLAHHPGDSALWQALASLILTRLEVDRFSGAADESDEAKATASLKEIFTAWREHKPDDGWKQDFLTARSLTVTGDHDKAIAMMETALDRVPEDEPSARITIESKLAEVTSKLLLTQKSQLGN